MSRPLGSGRWAWTGGRGTGFGCRRRGSPAWGGLHKGLCSVIGILRGLFAVLPKPHAVFIRGLARLLLWVTGLVGGPESCEEEEGQDEDNDSCQDGRSNESAKEGTNNGTCAVWRRERIYM